MAAPRRATRTKAPAATAAERDVRALAAGSAASAFVPRKGDGAAASLPVVARAAGGCTACRLHEIGTQTVFGEGAAHAALMLVGEQPGDVEDRAGRPFVGPAGGLLDRALESVGVPRGDVYVTNAVKHFNFVEKGKRRIHQKPAASDVKACKGWLAAEIELVRPRVIVCLGATAAQALLGPAFRLTKERGKPVASPLAPAIVATYHPSALLRAPDEAARRAMWEALVADLDLSWRLAARTGAGAGAAAPPG
jgi:DNA polymerase